MLGELGVYVSAVMITAFIFITAAQPSVDTAQRCYLAAASVHHHCSASATP